MRRGSLVVFSAAIFLLLASIPAAGLGRAPAHLAATSTNVTAIASATPSPSASPSAPVTPEPAQAAQRNAAAAAAAAAPPTRVVARISSPRIRIRKAPVHERSTDAKGVGVTAHGYPVP